MFGVQRSSFKSVFIKEMGRGSIQVFCGQRGENEAERSYRTVMFSDNSSVLRSLTLGIISKLTFTAK